jgi:hypothetical protein
VWGGAWEGWRGGARLLGAFQPPAAAMEGAFLEGMARLVGALLCLVCLSLALSLALALALARIFLCSKEGMKSTLQLMYMYIYI